ncbi:MAG TPA: hypothetical protein VGQ09_00895 [Chitinophagaceae bacterium]|jgi:hypothetical protein|nr:hypothetical protein [Chitinophagaceae bacterium]
MNCFAKLFYSLIALYSSVFVSCTETGNAKQIQSSDSTQLAKVEPKKPVIDTALYNTLLGHISNGDKAGKWPVKDSLPLEGAILPFNRIVAFYGNLYSKNMGILGELPKDSMLKKLKGEVEKWQKADTILHVIPALHYIAVTAQGSPGAGNTYRLRMPFNQIDKIISWAAEINALVFLDVQVGLSTLEKELPQLEKYLSMPNVHLGIDPEFSMKTGKKPGSVIGTFDATDINYAVDYLASTVKKNNLPPKILIVHRFTQPMVTNYKKIKLNPSVQIVMDMDGWGIPAKKINTYRSFIYPEPVQFTGFKLFYKNDAKRVGQAREMQPEQVLKLTPKPVYIQYQ